MKRYIYANETNNLDKQIAQNAFATLNTQLGKNNISISIICAGGFVLSYYNIRTTIDVDAFYKSNELLDNIIKEVGNIYNINTDDVWLNNSIMTLNNSPDLQYCELLYDFSNLKVYIVKLEYLLGMKLTTYRDKDILDSALIIKYLTYTDVIQLYNELRTLNFDIDISILLDAFNQAYGNDWIESYFVSHEKELQELY